MHKLYATVMAGLVAIILAISPVAAEAKHGPTLKDTYSGLYHAVAKQHGKRAPGRNIRKYGVRTHRGTRDASSRELARSIRTFRRWLSPPVPGASSIDGGAVNPAYDAGGNWAIPRYIVMCESHGDYRARNPSGAGGAYQIMPGTWVAFGGTPGINPADASPAEQDRVAARIYAAQGAGPWECG